MLFYLEWNYTEPSPLPPTLPSLATSFPFNGLGNWCDILLSALRIAAELQVGTCHVDHCACWTL
jgi:hypothetical protein